MDNEIKLSDLEYKVLQLLKEDSRLPASEIGKNLGISRVTVSRIINSLKEKGVKFTVDYDEGVTAFVITDEDVEGGECFELIDGNLLCIIKAKDLDSLEEKLKKIKHKFQIFLSHKKRNSVKVSSEVKCDYCGAVIKGEPLIFRRGKKIYYACCRSCLKGLKEKFSSPI